jgi:hypothetical protein
MFLLLTLIGLKSMLTLFTSVIKPEAPRQYPAWNNLITVLTTKTKSLQQRQLLAPGKDTPIIELCRYLLSQVDYTYLFKLTNDLDRYGRYFTYVRKEWESIYSILSTGRSNKDLIVKNAYNLIIPSKCINPIRDMPMDQGYEYWKMMRPLKILMHTSDEYTIDLIDDHLRFKKDIPDGIIGCLDPIMLAYMYFHWLKSTDQNYQQVDNRTWIHRNVWLPIQNDLLDIWLMKVISVITNAVMDKNEDSLHNTLKNITGLMESALAPTNQMHVSCINLLAGLSDIRSFRITANSFISSNILVNKSLYGYVKLLMTLYDVDIGRQFWSFRYLRDHAIFNIIYDIFRLYRDKPTYQAVLIRLGLYLNNIYRAKVWETIPNQYLKNYVERSLISSIMKINEDRKFVTFL